MRQQDWETCKARAFWDRHSMSYEKWIATMRDKKHASHWRVLEQSFRHMPARPMIRLLGEDIFVKNWPEWRKMVKTPYKALFDTEWGFYVTRSRRFGFNAEAAKLGRKTHQEMFRFMLEHEPMPIYQLAKQLNRPYRRVFDGVKRLADRSLLRMDACIIQGRNSTLVSVPNVNDADAVWRIKHLEA